MADQVKPLVFKTLDGEPAVPSWIRHAAEKVVPVPAFGGRPHNDQHSHAPQHEPEHEHYEEHHDAEPEPYPHGGPQGYAQHGHAPQARESIAPPPRRSSMPPRMTVPPAPVVITRPTTVPPPPMAPPAPRLTPEEQQEYAMSALELGSLRARTLANAESQLIELAVSIAEVIIEREIEKDPAIHAALARAAVSALGDTRHAKLRVSRKAFRAITEIHGEEALDVDGVSVELTLDNSLEGLSVVAESGASRVDGRVTERLAAVLRALEADHRRKAAGGDQ